MNKLLTLAGLFLLVSNQSQARITIYDNASVLKHVLSSETLAQFKRTYPEQLGDGPLGNGVDLTEVKISGAQQSFAFELVYASNKTGSRCMLTGDVRNVQVNSGGITSSRLSVPFLSGPKCN